ncbi:hypothetical protein GX51_04430 [Blastomyces parvus]|uniref:Uncharacterized protein n=1 Tax=Blastomyces parvus TaxID=2060905 RepID=A0A2B7X297_9EURO|nr:hypothetical protein GX51_04430 [Blastomyces parvus]
MGLLARRFVSSQNSRQLGDPGPAAGWPVEVFRPSQRAGGGGLSSNPRGVCAYYGRIDRHAQQVLRGMADDVIGVWRMLGEGGGEGRDMGLARHVGTAKLQWDYEEEGDGEGNG